jgi:hypothetical protein
MNLFVIKFIPIFLLFSLTGYSAHYSVNKVFKNAQSSYSDSIPQDTCIINGMNFEIINNNGTTNLHATIKNGKIKVISSQNPGQKFRIIRYVFSVRSDEKHALVRSYGDLVSYAVIDLLKEGETGDLFYFEDIIIVSPAKEILDNAVKPIIIKRL